MIDRVGREDWKGRADGDKGWGLFEIDWIGRPADKFVFDVGVAFARAVCGGGLVAVFVLGGGDDVRAGVVLEFKGVGADCAGIDCEIDALFHDCAGGIGCAKGDWNVKGLGLAGGGCPECLGLVRPADELVGVLFVGVVGGKVFLAVKRLVVFADLFVLQCGFAVHIGDEVDALLVEYGGENGVVVDGEEHVGAECFAIIVCPALEREDKVGGFLLRGGRGLGHVAFFD